MKAVLLSLIVFSWFTLFTPESELQEIQVNDVLVIQEPSGADFKHIHFPRKNFIIKRGGIATLTSLNGTKVVVEDVSYKDGATIIILSRMDGRKFFRAFPTVTAKFESALEAGELRK